jgi:hypothetical protein
MRCPDRKAFAVKGFDNLSGKYRLELLHASIGMS